MSLITIEEFQKVQLKTGKVIEVYPHPNADRLYILKVDLGGEMRQLVAGIKAAYAPEQLQGKLVVVAANLQPATIRGVESQGMVLAADDGTTVAVLTPDRPVNPGAQVR